MIPAIRNTYARRTVLVLSVAAILLIYGPVHLVAAALKWVEKEFQTDLRKVWAGK